MGISTSRHPRAVTCSAEERCIQHGGSTADPRRFRQPVTQVRVGRCGWLLASWRAYEGRIGKCIRFACVVLRVNIEENGVLKTSGRCWWVFDDVAL
jgi:hypothetical protein